MGRAEAFAAIQTSQARFSEHVLGMPLYNYQQRWAQHVVDVARSRQPFTTIVEMSRQSGKNETSAHIEVQLLATHGRKGGAIVKCAPTWKPQIVNSKLRFDARSKKALERLPFLEFRPSQGYIYRCHEAQIQFLSAQLGASVVGATASLLLEVDEAQDVSKEKYDKDFAPMRASTGAPVAFYGTTWTDDTLLEREKRAVQDGRVPGLIFRVLPEEIALENEAYGAFVDAEVRRLGREHPLIKTQYFLEPMPGVGRMLSQQALRLMVGSHKRQDKRTDERQIVAGLDFAGADEDAGNLEALISGSSRDSVALTIGSVDMMQIAEGIHEPMVKVLDRYEWVNQEPTSLHSALYDILNNRWKVDRVHCDATGVGATPTAFLAKAMNRPSRERVVAITFDSNWNAHSDLAFQFLAMCNGARYREFAPGFDPLEAAAHEYPDAKDPFRHAWWQLGHAKLEARPSRRVRAFVPDSEGHDDLLVSAMLMADAAYKIGKVRTMESKQVDFYT